MLIFFMKISTWRISTITGLERLTELKVLIVNNTITILITILFLLIIILLIIARLFALKVLNLAGNLIRKVTGVQNLGCVEELNLRWGDLTFSFKKHLNLLTVVAVVVLEGTESERRKGCSQCRVCRSCTCRTTRSKAWAPWSSWRAWWGCRRCRWRATRCGATPTTPRTSSPACHPSPPWTSRTSPRRWRAARKGDFSNLYKLILGSGEKVTFQISTKLDPVGSTVRYEMMKLCTGSV